MSWDGSYLLGAAIGHFGGPWHLFYVSDKSFLRDEAFFSEDSPRPVCEDMEITLQNYVTLRVIGRELGWRR